MDIKAIMTLWQGMDVLLERADSTPAGQRAAAYAVERVRAILDTARVRSPEQVWLREVLLEAVERRAARFLAEP